MGSIDHTIRVKGKPLVRQWLLFVFLLVTIVLSSMTSVDQVAEVEYKKMFQRAIVTFAMARTLNGVISVVQGTEFAFQPAGVGVTLTPGEILDPVNDLVERFSWIMLGATVSLGVQQVLLDVGQWWGVKILVAVSGFLWLFVQLRFFRRGEAVTPFSVRMLFRVFAVVLFIRFAVPLTLIANEALYDLFLEPRYLESSQAIQTAGTEIEEAGASSMVDSSESETGLMGTLERALSNTRDTLDIQRRVERVQQRASDLVEHLVQICVVFVVQTAILPIVFIWLLLQLLKSVFRHSKPNVRL